jgi:hypothetical protein
MATKGTDPMGIGVPTSYTPVHNPMETIRRSWETTRQNRLIKQENKRQDYKEKREALPTFEAVNQKVGGVLNEMTEDLRNYYLEESKKGDFEAFTDNLTKKGRAVQARMNEKERQIIEHGKAYSAMVPKYKAAYDFTTNPKNYENIDWETTQERMNSFETGDLQSMTNAVSEGLVEMKATPVDIQKWKRDNIEMYIPEETVEISSEKIDETTGKIRIEDIKYKDPKEAARQMRLMYNDAPEKIQKYLQKEYEAAPEAEKTTKDGLVIGVDDWFVSKHMPSYGKQIGVKYYAGKPTGRGGFSLNFPGRNDKGVYDFKESAQTKVLGTPAYTSDGETPTANYTSAATINLQGAYKKPIIMGDSPGNVDTQTGERAKAGAAASNVPVDVSFHPVATSEITVSMPNGKEATFAAGERIPDDAIAKMTPEDRAKTQYGAFLTSLTGYKKATESWEKGVAGIDYDPASYSQTTIRPWNESKGALKSVSDSDGNFKFDELNTNVNEMLKQLNANTADDTDELFEDLF